MAGVVPLSCHAAGTIIDDLVDDSRAVTRVAAVAVRGTGADGHGFVRQAVEHGAAAVVVESDIDAEALGAAFVVRVGDSRAALARLAATWFGINETDERPLRLIGVTGTNGKTTITWMIRSILQAAGVPTALLGTIEYDLVGARRGAPLTTPGSLELCRMLSEARHGGAEYAALEVSSHALDQRRCDGLTFAAGVFTNLTGDHLDYHGSMDAYFSAKRRLFEGLGGHAAAIVNADDAYGDRAAERLEATVTRYGIDSRDADVRAKAVAVDRTGTRFVLQARTFESPVSMALVGRHNVLNALAAAATTEALGIRAGAIRAGLERMDGVPGRLQRVESAWCRFSVLVDYAHTDDALRNVLRAVRPLTSGRVICVFGCGGDRDRTKRPRMARVVGEMADAAFVTSDNPRTEEPMRIIQEILAGFDSSSGCRVEVEADRRAAIREAIHSARPGDTVLIAGKGHETYQLVGGKVLEFDDAEVAREALADMEVTRMVEGAA